MVKILNKIFGFGVTVSLLAGGLSLIVYIIASFTGVETAEIICEFVQKQFYPYIIQIAVISAGLGLISMYISGTKALSMDKDKGGK